MKSADVAMYSAKSNGRNSCQYFTDGMNAAALERMELENDLRLALDRGAFRLHYQSQYDLSTGRLCGFEALLRWHHPTLGEIKPERLISIAEETRLILPLGSWVVNEAFRQLREWRDAGLTDVRMAINVSIRQLQDENFLSVLQTAMQHHEICAADIELEITESAVVENLHQVQTVLSTLRGFGVGLAIDDFGTGYSSLARLKHLPIQCVKIDRTFIQDIESQQEDAEICAAIIALAHSLRLRTVAEGVETEAQKAYLQRSNCDEMQGHLLGRPMSSDEVWSLTGRTARTSRVLADVSD
jgi:EAL domain-containing protein (putative c-di-GMP-specific phosphodiesterase class I)